MKVLIIVALAALTGAVPANRDKRSNGLQYAASGPVYQNLQSNSEHSTSYQSKSQQSTSLQSVVQPYPQYQQYQYQQPIYNVQVPYGGAQRVYNQQVYPVRQQAVYTPHVQTYSPVHTYTPAQTYSYEPVRTYAPVQTYAQTYTPVQTYNAVPINYEGQNYGNNWRGYPWC